jgi:hypothetical protein
MCSFNAGGGGFSMGDRLQAEKEVDRRRAPGICIMRLIAMCFVKGRDVQKSQRGVI